MKATIERSDAPASLKGGSSPSTLSVVSRVRRPLRRRIYATPPRQTPRKRTALELFAAAAPIERDLARWLPNRQSLASAWRMAPSGDWLCSMLRFLDVDRRMAVDAALDALRILRPPLDAASRAVVAALRGWLDTGGIDVGEHRTALAGSLGDVASVRRAVAAALDVIDDPEPAAALGLVCLLVSIANGPAEGHRSKRDALRTALVIRRRWPQPPADVRVLAALAILRETCGTADRVERAVYHASRMLGMHAECCATTVDPTWRLVDDAGMTLGSITFDGDRVRQGAAQ